MVCWFSEQPLRAAVHVRHQAHHPQRAGAWCSELHYRLDINTLHRDEDAGRARA